MSGGPGADGSKLVAGRKLSDLSLSYWPAVWLWHHAEHSQALAYELPGCSHDALQSVFGVGRGCHAMMEEVKTLLMVDL